MQVDHIAEKKVGMDKDKIRKAISRVKLEDEAQHERNIGYMDQDDDEYKSPWKIKNATGLRAVTDSSDLDEKPESYIQCYVHALLHIQVSHRRLTYEFHFCPFRHSFL